jgi:fructose-1,6-bisphosphatase/inositol monophosphatase family enzyme
VQVNGRMEHAVVYDPLRQELFTASRGAGAEVDGHKLRVSGQMELSRSLIGTGFPFRDAGLDITPYMAMLSKTSCTPRASVAPALPRSTSGMLPPDVSMHS